MRISINIPCECFIRSNEFFGHSIKRRKRMRDDEYKKYEKKGTKFEEKKSA